jgi:hypothetical protein
MVKLRGSAHHVSIRDGVLEESPTKMRGKGTLRSLRVSARSLVCSPQAGTSSPKPSISHAARRLPRVDMTSRSNLPSPFAAVLPAASRVLRSIRAAAAHEITDLPVAQAQRQLPRASAIREFRNTWHSPRSSDQGSSETSSNSSQIGSPLRPSRIPALRRVVSGRPWPPELELPRERLEDIACVTCELTTSADELFGPHGQPMELTAAPSIVQPPRPPLPPFPPPRAPPILAAVVPPQQAQSPPRRRSPRRASSPPPPAPTETPHLIVDEAELADAAATTAQMMRVDLKRDQFCFERADEALQLGEKVLAHISAAAAGANAISEAEVWRELLASAPGRSVAGSALVPRTPDLSSMRLDASERTASTLELALAAEALRGLLRVSICDENDLRLVRRVVAESRHFFTSLRRAADDRGVQPSELWRALELWGS